jgi:hypothetical protein
VIGEAEAHAGGEPAHAAGAIDQGGVDVAGVGQFTLSVPVLLFGVKG